MAEARAVVKKAVTRSRGVGRRMKRAARAATRELRGAPTGRRPAAKRPSGLAPGVIGMVEVFEPRQIVGWVVAETAEFPIRITLHVNDLEITSTWADQPSKLNTWADVRGFRIALTDIWKYCNKSDRVTVRIGGQALPIAAKGVYKRPGTDGRYSLSDLRKKFDEHYLFSQTGTLQLSKRYDTAWQDSVLGLYRRVTEVLKREYGYEPFVIYGTLLGLVREGGFIGHDIDFDTAYISKHTDGASVAAELRDIGFMLIDNGFDVVCRSTALHIHDQHDHSLRIDLFQLFFNENGKLTFPFGVSTRTEFMTADWRGLKDGELAGRQVKVPGNAEMLTEHIYGPSWRTPIAGFQWARVRTGFQDGELPPEYVEEVYWANFYARNELSTGSSFFDFVSARDDLPHSVIDIGCGDGRDSFAFARAGWRARGLDRSHIGIRHATKKAADAGLDSNLSFIASDVSDAPALREIVKAAREVSGGGPLLFYMRFFLHSIPEDAQRTLMSAIADCAQDGDALAAEFRTEKDKANRKVYGRHYRRYQDGFAYGQALREQYGFDVEFELESDGLAPYKDEDPVLYRVIARRGGEQGVAEGS